MRHFELKLTLALTREYHIGYYTSLLYPPNLQVGFVQGLVCY